MQEIRLACGTIYTLEQFEDARLSYVPCTYDSPLLTYSHLWGGRRHVTRQSYGKKWNAYSLSDMTGVQLMTGFPTYRHASKKLFYYYTSFDIERHMIETYPELVDGIRQLYHDGIDGNPCVIETKSGGLRLDAYSLYVGKKMSFKDDGGMLFEVLANKCLARIDDRYAMQQGSLLDLPVMPSLEPLQEMHGIFSDIATEEVDNKPREVVGRSQLGDLAIEWGSNGRSQLFPTQHCQKTSHTSNRNEVRFTRYKDGSVDGKCFNCGESWWEISPRRRWWKPKQSQRQAAALAALRGGVK